MPNIRAGRLLRRSSNEGDRPVIYAAHFALSAAFKILAVATLTSTVAALVLLPAQDPGELEHRHASSQHEHLHVHDEHHPHEHEGWEGPEPHRHPHRHAPLKHKHAYVIDVNHSAWPNG